MDPIDYAEATAKLMVLGAVMFFTAGMGWWCCLAADTASQAAEEK